MRNIIFDVKEIVETSLDIWVIYEPEKHLDSYQSLHHALWEISFDAEKGIKSYEIKHSTFFKILSEEDGLKSLQFIINTIAELLQNVASIGAMYGNLRTENIMIKLNPN